MAEEKEILLFEARFDAAQAQKAAEEFRVSIARLKAEKIATEKEFKAGKISAEEYGKSIQSISSQTAKASAGLKEQQKALADFDKQQKLADANITLLRVNMALETAALGKLAKAQRDVSSRSLVESLRATRDELKEVTASQEEAFDSITGTNKALADLQKEYNALTQAERENAEIGGVLLAQINKLRDAQDKHQKTIDNSRKTVKDYLRDINVLGISVGGTIDSFKSGAQGVATFAKGIFTARGALVALTTVPIILVLSAIVAFFTRSKDGAELFGRKMAAVAAVLDLVLTKVVSFGKSVVDSFSNPIQAIKDLGAAIGQNLTNRLSAVGEIVAAIAQLDPKRAINGFFQLLTGVTNVTGKVSVLTEEAKKAAAAGEAVARQAQLIADAERKLTVERARSRAEVEKLKQTGDDVSKSNEMRLAATKKAYAIENGLLQEQQALQLRKIDNIKAENALRPVTAEGLDKLAEAQQRYSELAEESTTRQIELNNKLNQIRIEGAQQAIQGQIAVTERLLQVAKDGGKATFQEIFDLEKKLLDQQLALSLVGVVKGSEQEKALRLRYRTELEALEVQAVISEESRMDRIRTSTLEAQLAQAEHYSEKEFNLIRGLTQQKYLEEVHAANATIKNKAELNAKLLELDAKYAQSVEQIDQAQRQAGLERQAATNKSRLAKSRAGSKEELKAQLEELENQKQQELNNINLTQEQRQAIIDDYARKESDKRNQYLVSTLNFYAAQLQSLGQSIDTLISSQAKRQLDNLQKAQDAAVASAGNSAEARAAIEENYAAKRLEIEKDLARKKRTIASIQNVIATAQSITVAFVEYGPILGAILGAIALANGLAQQSVIDSQEFARGGVLDGPSHAEGGIKRVVGGRRIELEGGEGVINKHAMAIDWVRDRASELNQVAGNGVAFSRTNRANAMALSPARLAQGGIVTYGGGGQTGISPSDLQAAIAGAVADAVRQMPRPVVSVEDIRSGVGQKVSVEQRASVGLG